MGKIAKVIMIPDETRVIINYGRKDNEGLSIRQKLQISSPGEDLIDPDTNELLGNYGIVKTILEITEIFDSYSIARDVTVKNDSMFNLNIISPLISGTTTRTYNPINVNPQDIVTIKSQTDFVSIGDYVQLIYS